MSKKKGRIAQDEVLGIVEQAIALERQRIEIMPDAEVEEVSGGVLGIGSSGGGIGTAGFFPSSGGGVLD